MLPPWQASGKTFQSLAATGARLFAKRLVRGQLDLPLRVLLRRWRRLTNALKKRSTPLDEARPGIITLRARSILVLQSTPCLLSLFLNRSPNQMPETPLLRQRVGSRWHFLVPGSTMLAAERYTGPALIAQRAQCAFVAGSGQARVLAMLLRPRRRRLYKKARALS